ncbi:MAG: DUF1232 domain-containing protein [Melioribacteraceae bacterium]|jgi:uncharacterized membrane protein YkvA (DUF1232 family)|nr:hypothetical protein [Ignavibacteriota bacterium]MBZ0180918.1 DUF1232 domain-containing protein [Melioribacteraceae bacterium]
MNNNYNPNDIDDLEFDYDTEDKVEEGSKYIEENLWEKVERVGKKISFAKDILALFRYMSDSSVAWYRKSIVVGALIYFISPIDAIPDLAPLFGYLDDLGVITAVLKYLGSELIPYYNK